VRAELKPLAWAVGFAVGALLAAGAFYSVKFVLGGLNRGSG
jgi:hypothetical protein